MSSDPVTLVLSIGSTIISVLGALRCVKSIKSCCCQVEIADQPPSDPKASIADIIKSKFTPRKPAPQATPPTQTNISEAPV